MGTLRKCTAAVLAGGFGTRLQPLVVDRPKVLAEVNGRPFLSFLFDQLSDAGCEEVILCTGHLGEQIEAEFGGSYKNLRLSYSREPGVLGTGGALCFAAPLFHHETVLVLNGDSFCDASLEEFYLAHQRQKKDVSMMIVAVDDAGRFGKALLDKDDRVTGYIEKDGVAGPGWINAGIYLAEKKVIESIPGKRPVSLENELLPDWISRGLYGHRVEGRFIDIGTVKSYNQAAHFFSL